MKRLKLGKRGKLAAYLTTWALVGIILLAIPTLLSPYAERTLTTPSPSTLTSQMTGGNNTTITGPFKVDGANSSFALVRFNSNNQTLDIQSPYPTNITIAFTTGNTNWITVTSTSPANITVTSKQSSVQAATSSPLSNIPDFALRLSLVLLPAIVISGLGMVRVRRRFRREFETDRT